ncbi:MAG: hypothetical protein E7315_01715 [Clostridiales bacterium]|nr:hypothetical protein [Clostridiales bacterium]
MSYCVNCGVELAQSEKRCPLCKTPVINPSNPWKEPESRPYPRRLEVIIQNINKRFFAVLASILLLIPVFICSLTDIMTTHEFTWSGYVVGALCVFFVMVLLPMFFSRKRAFLFLALDIGVILLYLFFVELKTSPQKAWFLPLALPLTVIFGGIVFIFIVYAKYKRVHPVMEILALVFASIGVYTVCMELIINAYISVIVPVRWSFYSCIPCMVIAAAFIILNRRKKLLESLEKRLFFK